MGQQFVYTAPEDWITEGSIWRPPDTITLRDETGAVIPSTSLTTMVLTLYDLSGSTQALVNSLEQVNILNARSCSVSTLGVLTLTLLPADTVILDATRRYEIRRALIEFTWATGAKSDALEITAVIRNINRRPYVAPPP